MILERSYNALSEMAKFFDRKAHKMLMHLYF